MSTKSTKKRTSKVQATQTKPGEEVTVVEVRFLLKVAGKIDRKDPEATDPIDEAITCMIDERIYQHRTNPPDPPESEPRFIDAASFRVTIHGDDF